MIKYNFVRNKLRYLVLFISFSCILVGIMRDENRVVLTKAINICLECIGIG